jgi:peptidoglycan/LPS O-acetylase OafA/YrhL
MTPKLNDDVHTRPLSRNHYATLDGLRGVAVLLVMVLHFSFLAPGTGIEGFYWKIIGGGWAGVDLFFVLSGFLITGILYDAKGSAHFFRNFFARRILRIFPLYYGFLIVLLLLLPLLHPAAAEPFSKQLWLWTYFSNVLFAMEGWEGMPAHTVHLWSLAVEEQFYLIWPFVVFLLNRRRLIQVCMAAIALATLTRIGLHFVAADGIAGYALLPSRMDALALGGLMALLMRGEHGLDHVLRLARPMVLTGAALVLATAAISTILRPDDSFLPALGFHVQIIGYPGIALLSAGVLVSALGASPSSGLSRLLTVRPLMKLGQFSYGLYMIHILVRDLLRDHAFAGDVPTLLGSRLPVQLGIVAFGIAASYSLASLSWYAFERHFLSLKRHFEYDRPLAAVQDGATRASLHPSDPQFPAHAGFVGQSGGGNEKIGTAP